ncbi:6267_t:CDS:10, partial [Acaulospora morrowiae]
IDRTSPTELNVIEDDVIYSKQEINDILAVLEEGNRISGGLKNIVTAYGIVGFIRFTEGYYISLITKRSAVALIGGHYIYHIDETLLRSIGPQSKPEKNSDEYKYINIFNNVDLTKNFYFSYTYDITHTLQYNMTRPPNRRNFSYNEMFVWNHYLLETGFRSLKNNSDWILPIIHGFVDQSKISIFGRNIFVTLIARRSRYFAGARFLKRGVNDQGYVANDVETEQIVSEMSTTSFHSGTRLYDNPHYTSYVQHRGSIPLFWSQDTNMSPKPPIIINFRDPFYAAAALHYDNMFKRYGAPIIVLNLIKTKEKNPRESILGDEFAEAMKYLMQFLPEKCLKYQAWDMSKARKSDVDVMELMEGFAEEYLVATGFFHSGPEAYINILKREENQGKPQTRRMSLRQNGVVRTNCIDCLDRTNAAQLMIGKCALGHQLYALGIIDKPRVDVDSDVVNMLTDMYHDHGDTIAFQYGGSNLVNTIDSYRKINQWNSHSRDLIENLRRYYNNAFADADKQDAINLFLGNFVPQKDQSNLWDLPSDYFLHNEDPRFKRPRRSYINWWTKDALSPREDQEQDSARYRLVPRLARQFDDECDPFSGYWIEYYRPRLFTSFEYLFAFNMNSTTKYIPTGAELETYDYSPFTVRVPQATRYYLLMNIGGVKKWVVPNKPKEESITMKSLNPSVSSNEKKEYEQYITQNKDLVLTSTPIGDNDPALTCHSEYPCYAEYVRRANLPNPITDIRVQTKDEIVYEDCLDIPKKYAMMQAVGSSQPGGAKSRYQAYEVWLKTGKLMSNNRSSESRLKTSDRSLKNESYRKKIKENQIKE